MRRHRVLDCPENIEGDDLQVWLDTCRGDIDPFITFRTSDWSTPRDRMVRIRKRRKPRPYGDAVTK